MMGWRSAASRWAGELPRKWLPPASEISRGWSFSAIRCILRVDPIVFAPHICRTSRRRCCSSRVRATHSAPPRSYVRSSPGSRRGPISMSWQAATTHSRCRRDPTSRRKTCTARSRTTSLRGCARRSLSGQRDERGRNGAAEQRFARLPLGGGVEGFEKLYLASGEERYQQAVAIEQPVAGQRGKSEER